MIVSHQSTRPNRVDPLLEATSSADRKPLDEEIFQQMMAIERKRTERTKAPFLLMLLEVTSKDGSQRVRVTLDAVTAALLASSRDTDLIGWYKDSAVVGAMFTGLEVHDKSAMLDTFLSKISATLQDALTQEQFEQVNISFHLFPDDWDQDKPGRPSNPVLYPDLASNDKARRTLLMVKRAIDLAGSIVMLILCAPIFLVIAIAIKMTSDGPVFFRQQRVGRFGQAFTFLKFRSMYVKCDPGAHKEFVTRLISNQANRRSQDEKGKCVYKLTNDKRITPVGKFLRRTSLDELPQFLNVLKGEMSLVGPRPPIPYELAAYQIWHRHRLLGVKPGITGLWQVLSRSSVEFDDMVRLDLRYMSTWTLWMDLKILIRTPFAVIKGSGAY